MSAVLSLPMPHRLPTSRREVVATLRHLQPATWLDRAWADLSAREDARRRLAGLGTRSPGCAPGASDRADPDEQQTTARPAGGRDATSPYRIAPPTGAVSVEQLEHDRYFDIDRIDGDPAVGFVAGLLNAHIAAYDDCVRMGVTLLDQEQWHLLFDGFETLLALQPGTVSGTPTAPPLPLPPRWTDDYDPTRRWLVGHQLFFALIQGAIVGLNWFATAQAAGDADEAQDGLALAAAFMRSSAASMRLTSDFTPDSYDSLVRPAMAPPAVRNGFSGLQTRDHAHLVRLFAALKPILNTGDPTDAHREFVESVVTAYASHEFICARFRGDVLPSLRMAATTGGRTRRSGVDVVRDMMRARLALIDPGHHHEIAAAMGEVGPS